MVDFETIVFFRDQKKSFNKHKRDLRYALSDIWRGIKNAVQSRIKRHFRRALSQIGHGIKNIAKTALSAIITTLFFPLFFLMSALIDMISIPHRIWAWATKKSVTEPKSVANGAKINIQNNKKATALMAAVCNNNEEIVSLLLGDKTNNDTQIGIDIQDQHGSTALMLAVFYGYKKIVRQLLEANAKLDIQDICGSTALIRAAFKNQIDIALLLLEKGAASNIKNHAGDTALNVAAFYGHEHIVELLLKKDGLQNELPNIEGRNALIIASMGGYKNIVSLVLAYKAKVNIQDKYGYTAFAYATEKGYTEIANLIRKSENYKACPHKPKSLAELELVAEATLLLFCKNANNPIVNRRINKEKAASIIYRGKNSPPQKR